MFDYENYWKEYKFKVGDYVIVSNKTLPKYDIYKGHVGKILGKYEHLLILGFKTKMKDISHSFIPSVIKDSEYTGSNCLAIHPSHVTIAHSNLDIYLKSKGLNK